MPDVCGSSTFVTSLLVAASVIFVPSLLADDADARRLGYYGTDYEGNLCGQRVWRGGVPGRDLQARPYMYWLNSTTPVCTRACPRLADELICEYAYQSVPLHVQRAHLNERCFAQRRTRAVFLACLPLDPEAAPPIDRWLMSHYIDQLAADTLQASGVLLGCWAAAGMLALLALLGLLASPRLTLLLAALAAVGVGFAASLMMLPHGARVLTAAREYPLSRGEAPCLRDMVSATFQLSAGWAVVLGFVLLVIVLATRARHAPVAASLIGTAAAPLLAMPALLLLPLYLFVAVGGPLAAWVSSVVYVSAPCAAGEECSALAEAMRTGWPLTLLAPLWIASAVVAWTYVTVAGAAGCWYKERTAAIGKGATASAVGAPALSHDSLAPLRARWVIWRSGWLAVSLHLPAIASATLLMPLAATLRLLTPPVSSAPKRSANPFQRMCLGCVQSSLRCANLLSRPVHPGGLVRLALYGPIVGIGPAASGGAHPGKGPALQAAAFEGGAVSAGAGGSSFLDAGSKVADLFHSTPVHVADAREHVHFFFGGARARALPCALLRPHPPPPTPPHPTPPHPTPLQFSSGRSASASRSSAGCASPPTARRPSSRPSGPPRSPSRDRSPSSPPPSPCPRPPSRPCSSATRRKPPTPRGQTRSPSRRPTPGRRRAAARRLPASSSVRPTLPCRRRGSRPARAA